MGFSLEAKSGIPICIQLRDQIKYRIASGELSPGSQMPTVRQMAVDLQINPNTVARVYSELEAEGLLVSQQGRGTYVAEVMAIGELDGFRQQKLTPLINKLLTEGMSLGFSLPDIRKAVEEELGKWEKLDR